MGWTNLQSNGGTASGGPFGGGFATALGNDTLLTISLRWQSDATIPVVIDQYNGIFSLIQFVADGNNCYAALYYCQNTVGAGKVDSNISIAWGANATNLVLICSEWSAGAGVEFVVDGFAGQAQTGLGTGGPLTSGSFNTTYDGDLIWCAVNLENFYYTGLSYGSGFSGSQGVDWDDGDVLVAFSEYKIQSSHGSIEGTSSVSFSTSGAAISICAAFAAQKQVGGIYRGWQQMGPILAQ